MLKSLFRIEDKPGLPQSFGYKVAWLSLKTIDTEAVAEALGLKKVRRANWKTGLEEAYKQVRSRPDKCGLFITPPLGAWTLVVGQGLCAWCADEDLTSVIQSKLSDLSRIFGEAQYFLTHRVVEMHVWARAINGNLIRGFAYLGDSGETPWNEGPQTEVEKRLGINFFDHSSPEAETDEYWKREDLTFPNEEYVMQVAEGWSISPVRIEEHFKEPGLGRLGWIA